MSKQNIAQEVRGRIKEMTATKKAELEIIENQREAINERLKSANEAVFTSSHNMDIDAFQKAVAERETAQIELDMYNTKFNQIRDQEYITEEESDRVIDSLMEYEKQLSDDFEKDIIPLLKKLSALYEKYTQGINETEEVIWEWTRNIHANYRNPTALYSDGTNRSSKPLPVRNIPFSGCAAAQRLGRYLNNVKDTFE